MDIHSALNFTFDTIAPSTLSAKAAAIDQKRTALLNQQVGGELYSNCLHVVSQGAITARAWTASANDARSTTGVPGKYDLTDGERNILLADEFLSRRMHRQIFNS